MKPALVAAVGAGEEWRRYRRGLWVESLAHLLEEK